MPLVNRWKYNAKTNRFECPACDYTHEEQAGVQMHYMRMHEQLGGRGKTNANAGKTNANAGECEHAYRLLSAKDALHVSALRAGYAVYCVGCGHLK